MLQLTLDFLGLQMRDCTTPRASRARVDHELRWKQGIRVQIVFRPCAKRYLLSVQPDGTARLVIPRRGTETEGLRFLELSEEWLRQRRARWQSQRQAQRPWVEGAHFLFRGEEVTLRVEKAGTNLSLRFADQVIIAREELPDYRKIILVYLRQLAEQELPLRTLELATQYGIAVKRISVRAQRTRWGSCSARGTISLNWRLIQAPQFVVDYLIIHELMHRREMNHSARYWKLVAEACPDYARAEQWLKSRRIDLGARAQDE